MSKPEHPGKIIYLDGNTQQVVSEANIEDVPESLRFAESADGFIPIVKVIATVVGDRRYIREYGPDGQLLRSTIQVRTP